jgi:hypothetical protein
LSAQQPHSQFRTAETSLDREIAPGAATEVALPIRFREMPGGVVDNSFLMLRLRDGGDWRVLARVRVTAGSHGEPIAADSVVVTVQPVRTTAD